MNDIEKAIRHFDCIRNNAKVILDAGFGNAPHECPTLYENRILYATLAINALKKELSENVEAEKMFKTFTQNEGLINKYLYRGKRIDNGTWAYGFFSIITKGAHINPIVNGYYINAFKRLNNGEIVLTEMVEIIPDSVGKATMLTDKNGKMIFEGDIVDFKTTAYSFKNCRVKYQSYFARFCTADNKGYEYPMDKTFNYEIVGNEMDNPKLLS